MARMRYVVTGGTGFIGRRVVSQILARSDDAEVWVLVRRESLSRFERLATEGDRAWGDGAKPLVGDLTAENLGLTDRAVAELGDLDHVVHCAAIYDITADDADAARRQRRGHPRGDRPGHEDRRHAASRLVDRGRGQPPGEFTEDDFDVGQDLPTPYHQTKFEAEWLVRTAPGLRVPDLPPRRGGRRLPHRRDGQGRRPVLLLRPVRRAGPLPRFTPLRLPDAGRNNIVPVDYVVDAMVELMHQRDRDGQTFHLTAPKSIGLCGIYRAIADAADLPPLRGTLPPGPRDRCSTPPAAPRHCAIASPAGSASPPKSSTSSTWHPPSARSPSRALRARGITVPEFASYAPQLWRYWANHLDPDRARRDDPAGPLVGKHVIITGASSGIGRASAIAVAERGATVFALARNAEALDDLIAEIRAAGGQAHAFTCDVTDSTSVEHTVKDILGRFGHVDYLVNNAGRSIRRSVIASTDRLHDYERVMAVNYFGAVRMVLALLPHWRERRFGHVVNVSSAGVQANGPKYSAYLPSKAALDAFSDVVAPRRCRTTSRSPTSTCRWSRRR